MFNLSQERPSKLNDDVEKWILNFLNALNSDTSGGQITANNYIV